MKEKGRNRKKGERGEKEIRKSGEIERGKGRREKEKGEKRERGEKDKRESGSREGPDYYRYFVISRMWR